MRKTAFMKAVRQLVPTMSQEQLADFVLTFSEKIEQRLNECFLDDLTAAKEKKPSKKEKATTKQETNSFMLLKELNSQLEQIEQGVLTLDSEYNPEWNEWNDDDEATFLFADTDGIFPILEQSYELVSMLAEQKCFQVCTQMVNRLLELHITVDGDYLDCNDEEMSLAELDKEELLECDYNQLISDGLYALYCQPELKNQAEQFFNLLNKAVYPYLTLTAVLKDTEQDAQQLSAFLEKWIAYLGKHEGNRAGELLKEAIELSNSADGGLAMVEQYAKVHPSLYVWYLQAQNGRKADIDLLSVGEKAVQMLPKHYLIREKTALVTAEYALALGRTDTAEGLWLEAFRSNPTPVNLLRLIAESRDYTCWKDNVSNILCTPREVPSRRPWEYTECNGHSVTDFDKEQVLHFLAGNAAEVLEQSMNCSEYLGWSRDFTKKGFDLFLLALNPKDTLSPAFVSICSDLQDEIAFTTEQYGVGLNWLCTKRGEDQLWECLKKQRKYYPITDELRASILAKLSTLLRKRTEAIVGGGHRAYYGECAVWIAAVGEIIEFSGEENAKQRLMESYQRTYPRHYAFRGELEQLGFIYKKKSK